MRIILILLLILYAVRAHSAEDAVLFIDLNNSPKEVEAAREAAKQSGRKLVVFPDPDLETKKRISRLNEQKMAAKKAVDACEKKKGECYELREKYYRLDREKIDLTAKVKIGRDQLQAFFRDRAHPAYSSVVISGHDGTGGFSGDFGYLTDQEVASTLGDFPAIRDSIRSLHLWGCYTTSPGSLFLNWKKYFPNTALITGYEGRAPLNDKPAGWHYLKAVLAKEPELFQTTDSKKLQALLKKMPGATTVNSAIMVCDEYASPKDHFNLIDFQGRCEGYELEVAKQVPEYDCYLKAREDRCASPPTNVGSGPVRAFYELLHKASPCGAIKQNSPFRAYSRDSAIRLVFGQEVQRNFGRIYAAQIAETDALLDELKAPADIRFAGIGKMTRQEMLARADRLLAFLNERLPSLTLDPTTVSLSEQEAKLMAIKVFQRSLTDVMGSLSNRCVPFNWTEHDQWETSACVPNEKIGLAGVAKLMGNRKDLRHEFFDHLQDQIQRDRSALEKIEPGTDANATRLARARLEWLNAQYSLITYARYGTNLDSESVNAARLRAQRGRLLVELAEKGQAEPEKDPAVLKLTRSHNLLVAKGKISSAKSAVESLKQMPKNDMNENSRRQQEAIIAHEEAKFEALTILQSEASWDSVTGQAEHLNQLKEKIGRIRFEQQKREAESNNTYISDRLRENNADPRDVAFWRESLSRIQATLAQRPDRLNFRQLGEEALTELELN